MLKERLMKARKKPKRNDQQPADFLHRRNPPAARGFYDATCSIIKPGPAKSSHVMTIYSKLINI